MKNFSTEWKRQSSLTALACSAATLVLIASAGTAGAAAFENIAQSAGIEFDHTTEEFLGAPIGAGMAWVDIDGDGDDDIYAVQNCGTGDIPGNECGPTTGCNRMFRNEGDGSFVEITGAAGAALCGQMSRGVGVADYDNDGDQDIFVSQNGQNRLFRNRLIETGSATFVEMTAAAGLDDDGALASSSAVWGDFNEDGHLDLFVGNHRDFTNSPPGSTPPFICGEDYLWMNNGNGTFTNVAGATGIALSGDLGVVGCALAATWSDYDNDGDLDLAVINDFGEVNAAPNRLFRNDGPDGLGGWLFNDQSAEAEFDYAQAGMGIAIGDLNRDGWFDYYMSDRGANELALNEGDGSFAEIAGSAGVQAVDADIYGELGLVSWGNGFFDLDNDGWEDLVVANGGAPRNIWAGGMFGANYIDNNPNYVYVNNEDATFTELHAALGVVSEGYYRTAAMSDFDDDGDIDVYFGNLQGPNAFYRNDLANPNHWLKVKLEGTIGNRDAMGARVRISAGGDSQMREVSGGASFLSRHSLTQHFGLGAATRADTLEVEFLNGVIFPFINVGADQTLFVTEPIVTSTFTVDAFEIIPGDTIPLELNVSNLTATPQLLELWIDRIAPGGLESTLVGPLVADMAADGGFVLPINQQTGPAMPIGTHTLILRIGTYPGQVLHQDFAYVEALEAQPDTDEDGVADNVDNCTTFANASQLDFDGDGIGNACDPDHNQDCAVNFIDLGLFKPAFFGSDPEYDYNGDGSVDFLDLGRMKELFFSSAAPGPGPSGLPNDCD